MNNFHVYDEIGRGKHSVVYKGRRKKTLEYVAIKSVDKGFRAKTLNEVSILHTLSHENIVKFHHWYETKNHLWVIAEYCTGGDIHGLLLQDQKLPESSVSMFASHMLRGLQYLHVHGILYCDLKPSNILLAGNGSLKLCDFGLAQRISDISLEKQASGKRGTPYYMAPELFQPEGVHSYASDFWALGCVLYELAVGRPPFTSASFTELMRLIFEAPVPAIEGFSTDFTDLLNGLLEKDPAKRFTWNELLEHPWTQSFHLRRQTLPAQPVFEAYLRQSGSKADLNSSMEDDEDEPSPRTVSPKPSPSPRATSTSSLRQGRKPASASPTSSSRDRASHRAQDRPPTGHVIATPPRGGGAVDVTRLSMNALRNDKDAVDGTDSYRQSSDGLADQGDGVNAPTPDKRAGAGSRDGELILRNFDQELDFSEHTGAEEEGEDAQKDVQPLDATPRGAEVPLPDPIPDRQRPFTAPPGSELGRSGGGRTSRPTTSESRKEGASSRRTDSTASSRVAQRPRTAITGLRQKDGGLENLLATPLPSVPFDNILFHASDLTVLPIVPSKRRGGGKDKPVFNPETLPFDALSLAEVLQMESSELETFLTKVYRTLASHSAVSEKTNILSYFETLCGDQRSADLLVNSSLMTLLVKMLKAYKSTSLKVHLASVMGMLIRHATYIAEDIGASSKIISVLCTLLREQGNAVRRQVLACLGELLFYIATQQLEMDTKTAAAGSGWDVQSSVFAQIAQCLRPEEDPVVQYYAAKTIENISSHSADYAHKFAAQDVVPLLWKVFENAKDEGLRLAAVTGLGRILKQQRSLTSTVSDQVGVSTLLKSLADSNPKIQQAVLNIFNMVTMEASANTRRSFHSEKLDYMSNLTKLLDHSSVVIRAKTLLAVYLLSRVNLRYLLVACDKKLLPLAERIARDNEMYPRQCLQALMGGIVKIVPSLLAGFTAELSRVQKGQFKDITGPHLPLLLHLMTNSTLRGRVTSPQLIIELSAWLPQVQALSYPNQAEDLRILLLCTEAISQNPTLLLTHRESVVGHLLPVLTQLLVCDNGDTRFLCLKMLAEALILYVNTTDVYDCTESSALTQGSTAAINEVLVKHLLPIYPTILQDEDPIPVYGLKLLNSVVEANSALVSVLHRLNIIPMLFDIFELEHGHNNIHLIRLICHIVASDAVDKPYVYKLGLIPKVGAVLAYATANNVESFIDPVLDIIYRILYYTVEAVRGHSDRPPTAAGQDLLSANEQLLANVDLYIQLLGHTDVAICENASRSLYLFAQLYRSIHGIIMSPLNVEYIAQVLDTPDTSPLLARRVLKTLQCVASQSGKVWRTCTTLEHALGALTMSNEPSVSSAARELRNMSMSL